MASEDREQVGEWLAACDRYASKYWCTHRNVGAIIVKGDDIVAYGRNTMPGHQLCTDGGCPRGQLPKGQGQPDYGDCVAVHAEMNAIIHAGILLCRNSLMVVNSLPCFLCCRLARGAELAAIIYKHEDRINKIRLIGPDRV
jgi:deoxycytidylate deaminase